MDKITINDFSLRYHDGNESLRNINLSIVANAITVLFGPAGGGKSTLLRSLDRLNDLADVAEIKGTIMMNGENLLGSRVDVVGLRRKVGIVFSRPIPLPLTIYQNVSYALELAGERRKVKLDQAVEKALRQAALWDEVYDRLQDPASAISGGQQQRLCLARVLALEPEVIMLDEPTSALDPITTARIELLMQELKEQYTIVWVPHNVQQAARMADYAAFFLQGEMIEYGVGSQMFVTPKEQRTQDYITGRFG